MPNVYCAQVRAPRKKSRCFKRNRDAVKWAIQNTKPLRRGGRGGSATVRCVRI